MSTKTVRDFIYLDTEYLYSLYSQAFGGIPVSVLSSHYASEQYEHRQKGPPLSGERTEESMLDLLNTTEDRVLHDHMYSRLETELRDAILCIPGLNDSNWENALENAFLVSVSGNAEIENYKRLLDFMERYNELGEAIAYTANLDAIADRKKEIEEATDRNEKARLKRALTKDLKDAVENHDLHLDEDYIDYLVTATRRFYADNIEIVFRDRTLKTQTTAIYRGILERRWLRIQPRLLHDLYRGHPTSSWTLIGQLAYLKKNREDPIESMEAEIEESTEPSEDVKFRDTFEPMFESYWNVADHFIGTSADFDVVIRPLAIYRESELNLSLAQDE